MGTSSSSPSHSRRPAGQEEAPGGGASQFVSDSTFWSPSTIDYEFVVPVVLRPIGSVRDRQECVGQAGDHWIWLDEVLTEQGEVVVVVIKFRELDRDFDAVIRRSASG